jgi:Cu(I)/Ag(I) efflux system periplasmic protein CusF
MRKFVLIAQLVLGALTLTAFVSAPLTSAIAHEGEEHETINGVVQKVDETAGKITLKHGPIKSLGMDQGMTMVFNIDPNLLKGVKVGDKVMFQPERVNGQLTITKIEKAK